MIKTVAIFIASGVVAGLVRLAYFRPAIEPPTHDSSSQAEQEKIPTVGLARPRIRPAFQDEQRLSEASAPPSAMRFEQFLDTPAGDAVTDALNKRRPKHPEGAADPNLIYCVEETRKSLGDPNATIQGDYIVTVAPKSSSTVHVTRVAAAKPEHEGFVTCMVTRGVWPWVGVTAELPAGSPPLTEEIQFAYGYRYFKLRPQ